MGDASRCEGCGEAFSSFMWHSWGSRHHCRACGHAFCGNCVRKDHGIDLPFGKDGEKRLRTWKQSGPKSRSYICDGCISRIRRAEFPCQICGVDHRQSLEQLDARIEELREVIQNPKAAPEADFTQRLERVDGFAKEIEDFFTRTRVKKELDELKQKSTEHDESAQDMSIEKLAANRT